MGTEKERGQSEAAVNGYVCKQNFDIMLRPKILNIALHYIIIVRVETNIHLVTLNIKSI